MKKLQLSLVTACSIFALASCSSSPKDSTAKADSINKATDTAKKSEDAHIAMENQGDDAKFAVDAANGGMAEVVLGKLAIEEGKSPAVKEFGKMMVADHSKANDQLKMLAASKNITLPDSLNEKETKLKNDLSAKSGADFDKAYVDAMVADHREDIQAFTDAKIKMKYPEMIKFIDNTLPTLRLHLQDIEKIKKDMK